MYVYSKPIILKELLMSLPNIFEQNVERLQKLYFNLSAINQELPIELQSYIPTLEECFTEPAPLTWEEQNAAFIQEASSFGFTVKTFNPETKEREEYKAEVVA
jgi:hypothetical protein